jgi:hypothetical protein
MANAAQVLQQAHDLIEAGDYQAARQMLDTVRSSNENNPDFWWVYAHAVEDATEGRAAIERVRQLAPNYAGLESLAAGTSPVSAIKPLRPIVPPPPMSKVETEEDEFATTEETPDKKGNPLKTILTWVGLALLIIVVVLALVSSVLNNNGGATPTPERTAIVDNFFTPIVPTGESQVILPGDLTEEGLPSQESPVATEEQAETEIVATDEEAAETEELATATEVQAETEAVATDKDTVATEAETEAVVSDAVPEEVMEEIADFGVPTEGVSEESSSLGETLVVTSCTTPGPAASRNIIGILDAFKDAGVNLNAEAIAFNITDCTDNSVVISLGISSEIVESYWLGDTTASELLAALRRI